jgi:hypothetical protein
MFDHAHLAHFGQVDPSVAELNSQHAMVRLGRVDSELERLAHQYDVSPRTHERRDVGAPQPEPPSDRVSQPGRDSDRDQGGRLPVCSYVHNPLFEDNYTHYCVQFRFTAV